MFLNCNLIGGGVIVVVGVNFVVVVVNVVNVVVVVIDVASER